MPPQYYPRFGAPAYNILLLYVFFYYIYLKTLKNCFKNWKKNHILKFCFFVLRQDEQLDASVTETYMGEWKNDKRCGFGISERSDGLKYEGEWYNNRKYGYGVTTFRSNREEGKYKNNVLVTSNQKRHLFLIRSAKFRERIDSALNAAQRASKIALQKADIAISRYVYVFWTI